MNYQEFLQRKLVTARPCGLSEVPPLSDVLFPFQRRVVERALRAGRYALFLDTGLGKTLCQLEWARHVPDHAGHSLHCSQPRATGRDRKHE